MPRLGIVGYPNVGKTTLFNALAGLSAPTGVHPYSTTEPRAGVAKVADPRLDEVADLEKSAKVTPATLDLLDLPPIARNAQSREFLGQLREMEALVIVLRAFSDPAVPDEGISGAVDQAEELLLELAAADHEVFAKKADKAAREATADSSLQRSAQAIGEAAAQLARGEALRLREWTEDARAAFRDLAPLTAKPAIWVVNVDETATDTGQLVERIEAVVPPGDVVVALSARIEEEGSQLSTEERTELFEGLGLGEGALALMVRAAYQGLGLVSFYTVGPKESRAWTVREGAPVTEAAGKIHSDLQRGFIRAEVATIDQVIAAGGWDAAKAMGKIRVEGKGYVVVAGDVIVVRFSV